MARAFTWPAMNRLISLPAPMLLSLSGCAAHGAPSFVLFGAYFPAWMLLSALGIFVAIGARALLIATGLAEALPLQLGVCTAVGIIGALCAWLVWFAA